MKSNKMVAPIIITVFLVIYLGLFFWGWSYIPGPFWVRILGIIVPLGLIGVSIFVLVERIREIRSGEEDDLSKY